MTNYYAILNLPIGSSIEEVKSSFRKMVKLKHPDLVQKQPEKTEKLKKEENDSIQSLLEAYKVLSQPKQKEKYDQKIFQIYPPKQYLPKNRVQYLSLHKLLSNGSIKERFRRKNRLRQFGYDLEINLNEEENQRGTIARIPIAIKKPCNYCYGSLLECFLCNGLGNISEMTELALFFPPNQKNNSILRVDLKKYPLKNLAYFTQRELRICIRIID